MTDHAPPFNENENRQLLISWAIAPPTGKNLWERIQAHYNKQSTVNIARTPRQLRSRFDLLSVRLTRWYMALEEAKKMKETTDPSVELVCTGEIVGNVCDNNTFIYIGSARTACL